MRNNGGNRQSHLGYMIPVLLFVLFFAVCSGVLACVFLRAETVSARAKAYNDCVQLCRNEAERFRAGDEIDSHCWYNGNLQPTDPEQADYSVTVSISAEDTVAGQLRTASIRAFTRSGESLYELQVTRYCPSGR